MNPTKTKELPRATHVGTLKLGDIEFRCLVLDDKTRIISGTGFMKAMGMYRSGALSTRRKETPDGAQTPLFLAYKNLKPFINNELLYVLGSPVEYLPLIGKRKMEGIKAEAIPMICDVWLRARDNDVLGATQQKIAAKADIVMRALAHVGIIALVDEATGYQEDRARDELQKILQAYISEELLPWTRRFPTEFYKQMFRLMGWRYPPTADKGAPRGPRYAGKLTKQLVYEKLPKGVLSELEKKSPPDENWQRKDRLHQWLTDDIGNPHLEKQVAVVTTLMKISPNLRTFRRHFERAFPSGPQQADLFPELEDVPV
jgi:hypothetical protein